MSGGKMTAAAGSGNDYIDKNNNYPKIKEGPAVTVISPEYCRGRAIDIALMREALTLTDESFAAVDVNSGDILLQVKPGLSRVHKRKLILDPAGNIIVTLQLKSWSIHSKWQAFRGDSTDAKDLIFTTKMDSTDMRKAKMGVFLGKNKSEKVWDFKMKGGFFGSSIIYSAPDPSSTTVNIVVQVHHPKHHDISDRDQSIYSGKDNYMMRIYPNIDYAFIVSLLVILDDIYNLSARLAQTAKTQSAIIA
ncbi:Protein LURP-one-related 15 [Linum perenne]